MASSEFFVHGVAGIKDSIARHQGTGAAAARFIGLWHSHPNGHATPSDIDEKAMAALRVEGGRAPYRALLVILGGPTAWRDWLAGSGAPDVFAQLRYPHQVGDTQA